MKYKNLTLDKFQEDAIFALEKNHSVVVSAPTGSGKTLIADYIIEKSLEKGKRVIYTAPIKALSNQKYKDFCKDYGEENIGLMTGDIVKNSTAKILIMTTEIYRNMSLTEDNDLKDISYVVFDEIHYINDIERGYVWEESIIFSNEDVRFICLSATIPNAKEFADWISAIKKHNVETITQTKREVPLYKRFYDTELGITTLDEINDVAHVADYGHAMKKRYKKYYVKPPSHVELVREIKCPALFFVFSRKKCEENAKELLKARLFRDNPDIMSFVRKKLSEVPPTIRELKSTKTLMSTIPYGIAFHHAGVIPKIKEMVEELFGMGHINVLYTTETFAVGINMPAKTVCFESLRKYDGVNFRNLNSKEYFQIAGRAGRRGMDEQGFVYAMINRRDFDYRGLKKMTDKDVDPIKSQFKLSINTVLNLIKNHNEKEIDMILKLNFFTYQKCGKNFQRIRSNIFAYRFKSIKKQLINLGYVKDDKLTYKGEFSSRVYADEILIGEIFATDFYKGLNEYQILLIIACIVYESRKTTEFYTKFPSKLIADLKRKIRSNFYISKDKRWKDMNHLTALVTPCYERKTIFDILKNTNLVEGDLLRFFRQIVDRIGQVRKATDNEELRQKLRGCLELIDDCLTDIDTV
ncbi:DEAD/DEAH box helicase [Candidatus Woesearchaeota archaeon]|nr:DEAD/DEAH box helicase [Candidatus Woesearchaeota archaeon]